MFKYKKIERVQNILNRFFLKNKVILYNLKPTQNKKAYKSRKS